MKAIKRQDGYEIQLGDLIVSKSAFGTQHNYIDRVTSKYAFSRISDVYEAKYPRIVNIHFQILPKDSWSKIQYTVYTPIQKS